MITRCKECQTAFTVDDEKIENRKFAYVCPKCNTENIVDNRQEPSAGVEEEPDLSAAAQYMPEEPENEAMLDVDFSEEEHDLSEEELMSMSDDSIDDVMSEISVDESDLAEIGSEETLGEIEQEEDREPAHDFSQTFDEEEENIPSVQKDEMEDESEEELEIHLDDFGTDLESLEAGMSAEEQLPSEDEQPLDEITENIDELLDIVADEEGEPQDFEMPEDLPELADMEEEQPVSAPSVEEESSEEDITIDLDSLDIDLEEPEMPEVEAAEEVLSPEESEETDLSALAGEELEQITGVSSEEEEEDITIDLDSLDIPLEEEEQPVSAPSVEEESSEEDITIDLDSLDIDLEEPEMPEVEAAEEVLSPEESEEMDLSLLAGEELEQVTGISSEEEEDITLDLDSLDIPLEETDEVSRGEEPDEEKLTLQDAGLTIDELEPEAEEKTDIQGTEDEDIHLTLDEIDPGLDVTTFDDELKKTEEIFEVPSEEEFDFSVLDEEGIELPEYDEEESLPEIDLGESLEEEIDLSPVKDKRKSEPVQKIEEEIDVDLDIDTEFMDLDQGEEAYSLTTEKGNLSLSVDYSLSYSRLGAVLRLTGLYLVALVPHILVCLLYSVVSLILGFLEHCIVFSTGRAEEDFIEFQEKSLRYLLSIKVSSMGIVEEYPIFAGEANIDYPLQLELVRPSHYSRFLAFMRLTGVGILLISLPHIIMVLALSLVFPVVFVIGELSVLIMRRWPQVLFDFVATYFRYVAKVVAFMGGLIDEYPSFRIV